VAEPSLFSTNAERFHKVHRAKDRKEVHVSVACRDGTLKGGCHNCSKSYVDISRFAPEADSHNSAAKRQVFDAAHERYKAAYAESDKDEAVRQRKLVELNRTNNCESCRETKHLSPAEQATKDEWERMQKEACRKFNGCQNPLCSERGMASWCCMQADHGTNPKKRMTNGEPLSLSEYKEWPTYGGVEGMREEAKQIHQWICGCCHQLEPTSAAGRRCPDPDTMPNGKRSGTEEEQKQYEAKHHAKIKYPKQQYVDAVKRSVGCCQYPDCDRKVVFGNEQSFDWDHREESTKCKGGLFGNNGGVGGLVNNHVKAASLDKVQGLLDAEMLPKCDLLCHNCHMSRKQRGRERWDEAE
jgi:hypothetical protein